MADRVILLGPQVRAGKPDSHCPALEMTALDADALRNGRSVVVRLAQYSGQLANATVLELSDEYVQRVGGGSLAKAWKQMHGFLRGMYGIKELTVKTPIPIWNGGLRRWTDNPSRLIPEVGDLARVVKPIKLGSRKATIAADQNGLVDGVSDDEQTIVFKWRDAEGTHIIALGVADIEVVP